MSAEHQTHESHEGPIKTPKQLIWTVVASFVVPIVTIILLVNFVASGDQPAAGSAALGEEAIARRLQPIGHVEIRDASDVASLKTGEQVYQAVCTACHAHRRRRRAEDRRQGGLGAAHRHRLRHAAEFGPEGQGRDGARRAAATSPTTRSRAPWSTWPTRAAASSTNPRLRPRPPARPTEPARRERGRLNGRRGQALQARPAAQRFRPQLRSRNARASAPQRQFLQWPGAGFDRVGRDPHVQRVHEAEAEVGGQEQAARFVEPGACAADAGRPVCAVHQRTVGVAAARPRAPPRARRRHAAARSGRYQQPRSSAA